METPVDPPVFVIGTNYILGVVAALFLSALDSTSFNSCRARELSNS
jgi:hypothetical protein